MIKFIIPILFLLLTIPACNAQTEPQSYIAYKTNTPILIDGLAEEQDWKNAVWTADFIDIEGNKTPKYRTRVKMLWDEENIYFFAQMKEPHVWGNLHQRDTVIFYNNDFEIFIDPDGDTHNYYELEINALNTVWDLFLTKPYREKNKVLDGWDIHGLQTAVHVDGTLNNPSDIDRGWSVEIAIPWAALRTAHMQNNIPRNDFWRINFSRVNWDFELIEGVYDRKKNTDGKYLPEYNWVWSPQGIISMHEPEKWGYVFFSEESVGKKVHFIIPKDEKIKWYLYELYHQQKKLSKEDFKTLANKKKIIEGVQITPSFEPTTYGWNLFVKSPFSGKILLLKEDGQFLIKD